MVLGSITLEKYPQCAVLTGWKRMPTPPSPGFSPMEVEAARFLGRWQLLGVGNLRVLAVLCQSEGVIFYSLLVRIVGKSISFMLRRCTAETVACKFGPIIPHGSIPARNFYCFLIWNITLPPTSPTGFFDVFAIGILGGQTDPGTVLILGRFKI